MTDVLLICFSLVNGATLDNVGSKWYPEVSQHCADIPIILVGTQSDVRDEEVLEEVLDVKVSPQLHALRY